MFSLLVILSFCIKTTLLIVTFFARLMTIFGTLLMASLSLKVQSSKNIFSSTWNISIRFCPFDYSLTKALLEVKSQFLKPLFCDTNDIWPTELTVSALFYKNWTLVKLKAEFAATLKTPYLIAQQFLKNESVTYSFELSLTDIAPS